jgi:hypothetical protein
MSVRRPDEWAVEFPCPECGARDFETTRPGWVEGLGDWLRFGGRLRPPRQVCRRCGSAADARSYGALWTARQGWWSWPVQLVQTLRRRRTMMPVPLTYLAAAVAGMVLGVVAEVLFGWPWWLVTAALVAAVWLFFASSALWGARGPGPSLATDLLRVVRPAKATERDLRQEVERFRAAPFPLYGLPPAWPGPRHLGGWEGSWTRGQRPVTVALSLGHGDPLTQEGPQLRVEVRVEDVGPKYADAERAGRRRALAQDLWMQSAPDVDDPAERFQQLDAARHRPDPAWSEVTIPVDGRPVAFDWLAEGHHWVALARVDGRTLALHGRDLPVGSVELVHVTDLEPYVQGQRRLQEGWARHGDQEG